MAKMVQIRNVPDEVHAVLRRRAADAGMSLSAFLLREVTRVASAPTLEEVFARAESRGAVLEPDDIIEAIHAGRERREPTWS